MAFFEKQILMNTMYKGRIVTVRDDVVELQNGQHARREVVEHPGGVAIVPVNEDGDILMVRQYRYPMEEELLEIPAGKLDYNENHFDCAVRELSEETGCTAGKMVFLGPIYPSPGFSKEVLYIYLATELESGDMHLDENEFLSVETIPMDTLVDKVMSGEIKDGKTIIGILKAKKHLEQ